MTGEKGPLGAGQTRVIVKGMGEWILDENTLDLKDAFAIKATGAMTIPQMLDGILILEPLALQTLVWFLRMKAGDVVPLDSINFHIADFDMEQAEPEPGGEKEPDPTNGDGSTP